MTINLMTLAKWKTLEEGEVVRFHRENPRTVRIDVNAPLAVVVTITELGGEDDDSPIFPVYVLGRDRLEFEVNGAFELAVEGGGIQFYTVDGADWSVEKTDHATFTRVVERRVRNPEVDYMMYMMNVNLEKRLAQVQADTELRVARRFREQERARIRESSGGEILPDDAGKAADASRKASDSAKTPARGGSSDSPAPAAAGGDEPPAKNK